MVVAINFRKPVKTGDHLIRMCAFLVVRKITRIRIVQPGDKDLGTRGKGMARSMINSIVIDVNF